MIAAFPDEQRAQNVVQRSLPAPRDTCRMPTTPWTLSVQRTDRVVATLQLFDQRWFRDSLRAQRDLTAILSANPTLLFHARQNVLSCVNRRCVCPRPQQNSKVSLTQTMDPYYSRDLLSAFGRMSRQDSASTYVGTTIFLREHARYVNRLRDSLVRSGTDSQRSVLLRR